MNKLIFALKNIGYLICIFITIYIVWLTFVIVILTDPGNPYNG